MKNPLVYKGCKQQVKIIYYMSSVYVQVACTWDDIKSLRQDMDKSTAEGKVHFRGKLLQAISIMQVYTVDSHKFEVLEVLFQNIGSWNYREVDVNYTVKPVLSDH